VGRSNGGTEDSTVVDIIEKYDSKIAKNIADQFACIVGIHEIAS